MVSTLVLIYVGNSRLGRAKKQTLQNFEILDPDIHSVLTF